jgi:hypothetical protein
VSPESGAQAPPGIRESGNLSSTPVYRGCSGRAANPRQRGYVPALEAARIGKHHAFRQDPASLVSARSGARGRFRCGAITNRHMGQIGDEQRMELGALRAHRGRPGSAGRAAQRWHRRGLGPERERRMRGSPGCGLQQVRGGSSPCRGTPHQRLDRGLGRERLAAVLRPLAAGRDDLRRSRRGR